MTVLVTGASGFIGYHVCQALLARGESVLGVDEMNDYYPRSLKEARRLELTRLAPDRFTFWQRPVQGIDTEDLRDGRTGRVTRVIHLAARAGVRHSTAHPVLYGESNIMATVALFDACAKAGIRSAVYASSSSAKRIASVYGATKRACDDLAEAFAAVHGMALTGLRYHTVYGPWGRPDMAMWKFARAARDGQPIDLYNHGDMGRDFTFVSDVARATVAALDNPAEAGQARVLDIGRGHERRLLDMVAMIEAAVGKPVERRLLPMQVGDVEGSLADNTAARLAIGYEPVVDIEQGIPEFVAWYLDHRTAGGCP